MRLYFFDVTTGGRRLVMSDSSRTWLDVYDFYAGVQDLITFPAGTAEFFWVSDRDGWEHIYGYDYTGRVVNQVTRGRWSVTRIEGLDPKTRTIYYTATDASPLQRQLSAIRFDGSGTRRLTTTCGPRSFVMSPDARYYLDRWSSTTQPRQVELWTTAGRGRMLKKLEDNARVTQWVATHAYSPVELFSFTTSDSVRLDGSIIKPLPFDSTKRYPVVFAIYGGPGSQPVSDPFPTGGLSPWVGPGGEPVRRAEQPAAHQYRSPLS